MTVRRVTIPVTPELSWLVARPAFRVGEARIASAESLRELETVFAPPDCPSCFRFVERALEAISFALDERDDEPSQGGPTD
jgi:hypothetical protein